MKSGVVSHQQAVQALDLNTPIGSPKRSIEGTSPPFETLPADDTAWMSATIKRLDRELATERAARLQLQYTVTMWEQQYQEEQEANETSGVADEHGLAAREDDRQRRPQLFQTHTPAGGEEEWSDWKEPKAPPPAPGITPIGR